MLVPLPRPWCICLTPNVHYAGIPAGATAIASSSNCRSMHADLPCRLAVAAPEQGTVRLKAAGIRGFRRLTMLLLKLRSLDSGSSEWQALPKADTWQVFPCNILFRNKQANTIP